MRPSSSTTKDELPFEQKLLAGSAASVMAALFVTPLDVVKTRLQAQDYVSTAPRLRGSIHAFHYIAKKEGIRRLWSGAMATLWVSLPSVAMYMATYEELKNVWTGLYPQYDYLVPAVAGLSSRTLVVTLVAPMELIRTRIQAQPLCLPGSCPKCTPACRSLTMSNLFMSSVRERGAFSLWRGLAPTLARDIPFSAIYWMCVEELRPKLDRFATWMEKWGAKAGATTSLPGSSSSSFSSRGEEGGGEGPKKIFGGILTQKKMEIDNNNGNDSEIKNIDNNNKINNDQKSSVLASSSPFAANRGAGKISNNNNDEESKKNNNDDVAHIVLVPKISKDDSNNNKINISASTTSAIQKEEEEEQVLEAEQVEVDDTNVIWKPVLHHEAEESSLHHHKRSATHVLTVNAIAGTLSGMTAAVVTHPFDVVKTFCQTSLVPVSVNQAWRMIWRREGWRGLWRGLMPRTVKIMPGCAVVLASYEVVKRLIHEK